MLQDLFMQANNVKITITWFVMKQKETSLAVASEDTTVKFALRNILRLRYNMVRYEAERN